MERNSIVKAKEAYTAQQAGESSATLGEIFVVKERPNGTNGSPFGANYALVQSFQKGSVGWIPLAVLQICDLKQLPVLPITLQTGPTSYPNLTSPSSQPSSATNSPSAPSNPRDTFFSDRRISSISEASRGRSSSASSELGSGASSPITPSIMGANSSGPAERMFYDEIHEGPQRDSFLQKFSEKERKFQQAAYELLVTEIDYVRDMNFVVEGFFVPLGDQKYLGQEGIRAVFTEQFPSLVSINEVILQGLRELREEYVMKPGIGRLFEKQAQSLQSYSNYFVNHSNAVKVLAKRREKEQLNTFIKNLEADPRCKNLNLSSYLLKPVQRVMKYPLLLRELIKYSQNQEETEDLERAMAKIQGVIQNINEKQRQAENRVKIEEILSRLAGDKKLSQLLIPTEENKEKDQVFMLEGKVGQLHKGKLDDSVHLFLFSELLVTAKKMGMGKVISSQLKVDKIWPVSLLVIHEGWSQEALQNVFEIVNTNDMFSSCWIDAGSKKSTWISKFEELKIKIVSKAEEDSPDLPDDEKEEETNEAKAEAEEASRQLLESEQKNKELLAKISTLEKELEATKSQLAKLQELGSERRPSRINVSTSDRKLEVAKEVLPFQVYQTLEQAWKKDPQILHLESQKTTLSPPARPRTLFSTPSSSSLLPSTPSSPGRQPSSSTIREGPPPQKIIPGEKTGPSVQDRLAAFGNVQVRKFSTPGRPVPPS